MTIDNLLTTTWPTDRVVVGHHQGRIVALERGAPLLTIGPPRAGKTTAVVVPNVARWGGPVVATSIRNDVLETTYAQRTARGRVHVFDPTRTLGHAPAHYDFIAPCVDYDVARTTAHTITHYMSYDTVRDGEFWRTAGARLTAVLLYAAANAGESVDTVTHWLASMSATEVEEILMAASEPRALETYHDFYGRHGADNYVGSVRATALAAMRTYEDREVARSIQAGGLLPDQFLAAAADTLYLCLAPEEQSALAPYSALTVDAVVNEQHRRMRRAQPGHAPLLLALDEAMNIAPLRNLGTLASTAAGTDIQLITVAHDLSQIVRTYGDADAQTIVANHSLLLVGGGLREFALSALIDRIVDPRQVPDGTDWTGTASEWVRRLDPSQALLVHRNLPPLLVDLTRWFDDDLQVVDRLEALFALEPVTREDLGRDADRDDPGRPFEIPPYEDVDSAEWPRYQCGPTGVSARFPSSPEYATEPDGLFGPRHLLHHEADGLSVALDVVELGHTAGWPRPDDALERVAANLAHELDADVIALEPVRIGSLPALDVDLRGDGQHTLVRVTTAGSCLVTARVQSREPAHEMFCEFASTLKIERAAPPTRRGTVVRLDRTGRLTVPPAIRERLTEPLVISLWKGGVRVWQRSAFEAQIGRRQWGDDRSSEELRELRAVGASSAPSRLDPRGRMMIPERFRDACGIGLAALLTPTPDGFELTPPG